MASWQLIETAPKDGRPILVCWAGVAGWETLRWKLNPRTGRSYFGNVEEWDDYELADDQPTHWFDLPEIPGMP